MTNRWEDVLSKIDNRPREIYESILLIDGLNTFIRNFTVVNSLTPDGKHIGGLVGSLKSIGYGIKIINPTFVIVVFDGVGGSSNRRNLYPNYKINRSKNRATNYAIFSNPEEAHESMHNQIARLMDYLKCLPISLACVDGLEADDIIGYLVNKFEKKDNVKELSIMSADKDFLQLISDKTKVYSPVKKKIYTPKEVLEEYKLPCYNYITYKILLGDDSDNVPGVPGLGKKKIVKYFPELFTEEEYNLTKVLEKSKDNKEHNLYSVITNFRNQLEINNQLMNLKEFPISPENEVIIKDMVKGRYDLNDNIFYSMYVKDQLNNSIPYVTNWLNNTFGYLNLL